MAFISEAAASRLYLPSLNAFDRSPARRIRRVRSAAAKRRAFVCAESRALRWTERVQNTAEAAQTTSDQRKPPPSSSSARRCWTSADAIRGSSAEAGYFCSSVSG